MSENASPSMIENFKAKVRAWWADVEKLRKTPVPKSREADKKALLDRAEKIRGTIRALTNWSDTLRINELNGMGFLPLVPVAVIGGALASVTYWLTDYGKFRASLNMQADLISKGVAPAEAAAIAQKSLEGSGILDNVQSIAKLAAVIGAGFLIYKLFLAGKKA